jgi:hypothetical protein
MDYFFVITFTKKKLSIAFFTSTKLSAACTKLSGSSIQYLFDKTNLISQHLLISIFKVFYTSPKDSLRVRLRKKVPTTQTQPTHPKPLPGVQPPPSVRADIELREVHLLQ